MGINIGDNNNIKNSHIINGDNLQNKSKTFYEKHPILVSLLISLLAGVILLFPVWQKIIDWIVNVFEG